MPGLLADLTNDRGILLIYISTDYVFDGTSPPYDVRDKANPLNLYGKIECYFERSPLAPLVERGVFCYHFLSVY